jgi:hypothetical protein
MQDMTFIISAERAAAEIWETLGAADVNVEASCTFPSTSGRVVRIVVADEDAAAGKKALLDAGFSALDQHEVVVATIDNEPGDLGRLARRVADSGAKLTTLYMAMGNRVVVSADDLDKVRAILAEG